MKRVEALAIADYRSPRNATRSRNGNRPLFCCVIVQNLYSLGPLPSLKVQLRENLPLWIDPSDMKTTKTDEPDDVTVEEVLGVVQYELIAGDDVVGPLYNVM